MKIYIMKLKFVLLIGVILILFLENMICCTSKNVRQKINFNYDWEFFRIENKDLTEKNKIDYSFVDYDTSRTDFSSQFLNEYIKTENTSISEVVKNEINNAVSYFNLEYPKINKNAWTKVSLPHTSKIEVEKSKRYNWEGVCYYRKYFKPPKSWVGKKLVLEFEGAMQQSDVWLNGQLVLQHKGGYTPFSVDLTNLIKYNSLNEIIVRLDNRPDKNFPVGKNQKGMGFSYYSGIYRSVFLHITNKVHITDAVRANQIAGGGIFFRTPNVSKEKAQVLIKTHISNESEIDANVSVKQILLNDSGRVIKSHLSQENIIKAKKELHISQRFEILNPLLWHPDEPNLYELKTIVYKNDIEIDEVKQKVGFRWMSFSREEGFKLNGEQMYMTGTNLHQDYPLLGVALSKNALYRNMKKIKESGYNTVRLVHYLHDPATYDAADQLGLMLLTSVPGWQFFNNNEIFKKRIYRDIRVMIRRDRNHPSIILWEPNLNESYPPDEFRNFCHKMAHEELPVGEYFTAGETYAAKNTTWDVAINNWIRGPDSIFRNTTERVQNVQPNSAGIIKEYADWEYGGWNSTTRNSRDKGEQVMLQGLWNTMWEYNSIVANYSPYTIGSCTWAMFDNFISGDKLFEWGTLDYYRLPKFTQYFFRSQLEPYKKIAGIDKNDPIIFIANWWTHRKGKDKVVVLSNCDMVKLSVNDNVISHQKPDDGPNTYYGVPHTGGNPFDGGNCRYLNYPPFTFMDVEYKKGELKAEGYIEGKKVAEQIVRTPEYPVSIKIWADLSGKPLKADAADAIFVHAAIIDKNGTILCLDNETEIKFSIKGDAEIIGPKKITSRGGIASILLQSNSLKPGKIEILAQANKLADGKLILNSEKSLMTFFKYK